MKKPILLYLLVLLIPLILYGQDKNEPPIWSVGDNLYSQDKVEAPVWSVGDNWTWKSAEGAILKSEVVKAEGNLYTVRMEGDPDLYGYEKKTMNVKFLIKEDGRQFKVDFSWRKVLDFPMFVGKSWKDTTYRKPAGFDIEATFIHEFKMDGVEDITTSAGRFKCCKIRLKLTNLRAHRSGWIYYWYSPGVKNWIKREPENTDFWMRSVWTRNAELISYKLIRK